MLDYKKLWKHSLITAIIAKHINKFLKLEDDENLFSASILHDMGKIILDQSLKRGEWRELAPNEINID